MRYFKKKTIGHAILMGSRTFASLPKMLEGRRHIVISSRLTEADLPKDVELFHSLTEAVEKYKNASEEIFVIGGGMVYAEMIPYAKKLYLTEINAEDKEADTFFQPFDKDLFSRKVISGGEQDGISYEFVVYTRKESL